MVFVSGYILQTFLIFGSLILTFLIGLIPLTCCLLLSVSPVFAAVLYSLYSYFALHREYGNIDSTSNF